MIVTFSITNFRSFCGEETLSFVASKRLAGSHGNHATPIPDSNEKVLRTAVIYGANGAGKSNIVKALQYLQTMALKTRDKSKGTGREAFRFGIVQAEPSIFDLQFITAGKLYRYGIKADDDNVLEEWLVQVMGAREQTLFERKADVEAGVTVELAKHPKPSNRLKSLASVGGRANHTFLAFATETLEKKDLGEELAVVIEWFRQQLTVIEPASRFTGLASNLVYNSSFSEFAGAFLRSASTGVNQLIVQRSEIEEEELRKTLPDGVVDRLLTHDREAGKSSAFNVHSGEEVRMDPKTGKIMRFRVGAIHSHQPGQTVELDLSEESDGTRRLLDLTPALLSLQSRNAVVCIDEIDRSLHPELVRKFVEFFLESCAGSRQLIVTTHETSLLDQDLLRRDEIWFVEKDQAGASRVYSLLDFKVRKDLEIRKGYLQGRFGAVPFLGDIDRLMEMAAPNE